MKQSDTEAMLAGLFTGLGALVKAAWRWRLEILVALVPYLLALRIVGDPVIAGIAVAVLGAAFVVGVPFLEDRRRAAGKPVPRVLTIGAWAARGLVYRQTVARLRRRWRRACATAGLAPVRIRQVERTPAGFRLAVTLTAGQTAGYVERCTGNLASALRVRTLRVYSHAEDARKGSVVIVTADPLAELGGAKWPALNADRLSIWNPTPVGVDENGGPVTVTLAGHNLMLAGEPGAGKTTTTQLLVAACALDPDVELICLDGKEVDLIDWQPRCRAFAGAVVADASAALRDADAWMQASYARLREAGHKKVQPGDPLLVVVVDELAY